MWERGESKSYKAVLSKRCINDFCWKGFMLMLFEHFIKLSSQKFNFDLLLASAIFLRRTCNSAKFHL